MIELEYTLKMCSPLHVGGERGIRPSIIDLKVFRRLELNEEDSGIREYVAIPSSTIKGLMRSSFENLIRSYILNRVGAMGIYRFAGKGVGLALGGTALLFSSRGSLSADDVRTSIDGIARTIISRLEREHQVISRDLREVLGLISGNENNEINSVKEGIEQGLRSILREITNLNDNTINNNVLGGLNNVLTEMAESVYYMITSFFPYVCDPTASLTSCISDTSVLDLASDRLVTFRYLLNVALLRKKPLMVEMCPVCLLFGGIGRASPLIFTDAVVENGLEVLPIVTRVSIDRYTQTAKKGKLFTLEYVPPNTNFKGKISIIEEYLHPIYRSNDCSLCKQLIKDLIYSIGRAGIGGMRGIGYGLASVRINGEEIRDVDLTSVVEEVLHEFNERLRSDDTRRTCAFIKRKLEALGIRHGIAERAAEVIRVTHNAMVNDEVLQRPQDAAGGG